MEQLIPVADKAALPLTHLAMAFVIAHPGATAALLGPRTMEQLDDPLDMAYNPPAVTNPGLRRRPAGDRAAA